MDFDSTPMDETAPMSAPKAEPAPAESPAVEGDTSSIGRLVIRYGAMQNIGEFRHDLDKRPLPGVKAVIRTDRGVELGEVLGVIDDNGGYGCISRAKLQQYIAANGSEYPYYRNGKVLRLANSQDVIDHRHLVSSAREEIMYCRQQIREMGLGMKLVTVEHLLGGERIIFYFSAENRVDFRDLVRCLASQYRTRIEMRQVGARDEARLVGDFERCGNRCCCQQYIKDLKPVSMRMAKTQKATLDPTKISGRCGRLMCCLRYEDDVYEELRKKLPRKNTWVRTASVVGKVIDGQIITQLVRLLLPDNTLTVVANEEIVERDVPAPAIPERVEPDRRAPKRKEPAERKLLRDTIGEPAPVPAGEEAQAPAPQADEGEWIEDAAELVLAEGEAPGGASPSAGAQGDGDGRKKRRRRKRRRSGGPEGAAPQGSPAAGLSASSGEDVGPDEGQDGDSAPDGPDDRPAPQGNPSGEPSQRKRRRRRRRGGNRTAGPASSGEAPPAPAGGEQA